LAGVLSSGVLTAENMIHVVGRGETIYSISRFYSVSADELMRANGITDPSKLQAGGRLTIPSSALTDIPVSSAPPAGQTSATSSAVSASSRNSVHVLADYRVIKGDTLFGIARNNRITLQVLLEINNFSANHVIKAGDIIKVPGQNIVQSASGSSASGTAASAPASATAGSAAGILSLRWPVNAREINYMTGQMGVIVEGEHNEAVKSLTQGKVISAGPWRKYGRVVIVEAAGGYFYMYGGCESLSVKVGDSIAAGTELGKLGVNTVSDRPQLFFMVFHSDTPIDPVKAPRAGGNAET